MSDKTRKIRPSFDIHSWRADSILEALAGLLTFEARAKFTLVGGLDVGVGLTVLGLGVDLWVNVASWYGYAVAGLTLTTPVAGCELDGGLTWPGVGGEATPPLTDYERSGGTNG